MRISTNQLYDRSIQGILDNQGDLSKIQQQLSSGKRIITPSDDPVGVAQVIRLTETLDQMAQYQKNNNLVTSSLEQQETALSSISDALNRARQLAIQSGNGIMNADDREAISLEIKQIRDQVFDLMNSRNADGDYIFAGYQSHSPAFSYNPAATGNKYQFEGDEGFNRVQISANVAIQAGDSGKLVFENVLARHTATVSGGSVSAKVFVDQQAKFDRFFSDNYDAVTAANNNLRFTVNGAGNQVTVTNVGTGATLDTLDYDPTVPFNYQGLQFNFNGGPGDTVDFQLDTPQKKNVAETLNDFFLKLQDPDLVGQALDDAIRDVMTGIDNGQKKIGNTISAVGGRLNVAESVYETNLDQEITLKTARGKIEDVDYAEAISELSKQETALQAAQQTFGRVTNLSLFDYL